MKENMDPVDDDVDAILRQSMNLFNDEEEMHGEAPKVDEHSPNHRNSGFRATLRRESTSSVILREAV